MRRKNSKYRRQLERLPDEVKSILEALATDEYLLENYYSQYMGWRLEISIKKVNFILLKECGQIFVSKIIEGEEVHIHPKDGSDEESKPEVIAKIINAQVA
ncbi:MAG: hypothetical protein KJO81_07655 [Gammaproteobacteria bacterium]|nr:hypothetical protein [Gammaproteobacteria bacterium]